MERPLVHGKGLGCALLIGLAGLSLMALTLVCGCIWIVERVIEFFK